MMKNDINYMSNKHTHSTQHKKKSLNVRIFYGHNKKKVQGFCLSYVCYVDCINWYYADPIPELQLLLSN